MMSSSNNTNNASQSPAGGGLKTYFKTPEGRYKLQYEKTHPAGLLHYAHGKTLTQVSISSFLGFYGPSHLFWKKDRIFLIDPVCYHKRYRIPHFMMFKIKFWNLSLD